MVEDKKGGKVDLVCVLCRKIIFWYPKNGNYPLNANYISSEEKEKGK